MQRSRVSILPTAGATCALLLLWTAAPPRTAQAAGAGYALEKLLLEGDPDPRGGTVDTLFIDVAIAGSRVEAMGISSAGDYGLYRMQDGALSVDVAEGDPVPGSAGDVFSELLRPELAGPDALAYAGSDSAGQGGFLYTGETHQPIALPGDVLAAGGTITEVSIIHSGAPGPWVALGVQVDDGGSLPDGVYLVQGPSGLREVYRQGSAAPAGVGGAFTGVSPWEEVGVAADGSLTFRSAVVGGSADAGIFRAPATGAIVPLLLAWDAVTTPGGGFFTSFGFGVSVNDAGDAAFAPEVWRDDSPVPAVFVLEDGVQREIVFYDDPLPEAPDFHFVGLGGNSPPVVDGSGRVAFVGAFDDVLHGQSLGAVLVHDGSGLSVLVKTGDPVPGVPGAVFTLFREVRIDEQGSIAINAATSQGAGIFLATRPAQIPALPAWTLPALAALLAGGVRRQRSALDPRPARR